jgi:ABC-type branched-subunit amino acid transport system substrate-binding protein
MRPAHVVPLLLASTLLVAACGGGSHDGQVAAEQPAGSTAGAVAGGTDAAVPNAAPVAEGAAPVAPATGAAPVTAGRAPVASVGGAKVSGSAGAKPGKAAGKGGVGPATAGVIPFENATDRAGNDQIAQQKNYATDTGVTKDQIKLGMINMHGLALGNVLTEPVLRGEIAAASAINDRGGIFGRRLQLVDCDDGPGEVSRTKACVKKLASQDKVFSLLSLFTWGSASIHSDLAQNKLPQIGSWAYSQTEWQDPYMFPTHMSMIHEAMAGANWVKNVVKPKTYGLICLTSPEMQLACAQVQKILDASGSKMVKKLNLGISETSLSAQVLAMRAANPDHIIHYVINPATMVKFMVEAAQQGYYPPQGISGNHLAAEVLGSLFGKWPAGRYWTNTTYKLWGSEFMAVMNKYARGNAGMNHHIVQAAYVGLQVFEDAARQVGPNLTRERLMAQLANGSVYSSDASMDQRFSYTKAERSDSGWNPEMGQGREFMYEYTSTNTVSDPNGSPSGFAPDQGQFVIHTNQ